MSQLSSDKPILTILTLVIVVIVVVAGAVVTIVKPESLSFHQYVTDVAIMGGALGLGSGIGRGLDAAGQTPNTQVTVTPPAPYDKQPEEQSHGN